MVTQNRIKLTPRRFGLKLDLALMVAGLSYEEAGQKFGEVGYKEGGLTGKTVWSWTKGYVKEVTWSMLEASSAVTKQRIEYFLGQESLDETISGFRPRSVAQNSGKQNGSSRKTGESGGARTLDTRIKSPAPLALNFANLLS